MALAALLEVHWVGRCGTVILYPRYSSKSSFWMAELTKMKYNFCRHPELSGLHVDFGKFCFYQDAHEREGPLSPLISSLIRGWRIVCSMCCGAVLASERMLWMKLFKSTAKICKRERERESSVWLWWRCFIYFYHLFMNYWSWNWEDIFLGVWADSVLSYIKFKPFWERRTVLLPQIFRLKTWQRDPTETTEKHIRRRRLWCFGPSNRTILF